MPSGLRHDNYGYQEYDPRLAAVYRSRGGPNSRDAALLRRPNFAHPDMSSLISATESDTPSDVFMEPMLHTPAMPILPDMPTRSRKLLEDLGSSPIASAGWTCQSLAPLFSRLCLCCRSPIGLRP